MHKKRRHRSKRRDHRARTPKKRRLRNLDRFIPRADSDFAYTAKSFVHYVSKQPQRYGLTADDAATIEKAVAAFREALAVAQKRRTSTMELVLAKDAARQHAELVVRQAGDIVRANPDVSAASKRMLRIKQRPTKNKRRDCPSDPPVLKYVQTKEGVVVMHDGGQSVARGVHVISYEIFEQRIAQGRIRTRAGTGKPDGAVRVEVFCDLVPPEMPVPKHPGEYGRWPLYLRSYTRSPMEVEFPLPSQPMRVVYWARWANATGQVSRCSKTCVGPIVGGPPPVKRLDAQEPDRLMEPKFTVVQMPEFALPAADDAAGREMQMLLPAMVEEKRLPAQQ